MQSIIKQYPEAKQALSEYMAGLIDEQELFAQLEQVYEDDKNAYADKIYEQMETTTQFLENISRDYPDFFDFLSDLYQGDLGNYTTVAELKKEIDTALVSELDSLWRGHYQLIQDKATGLYSAIIDDQAMLDGTISEEESDNILNGISDEVERANSALTRLNEIKNSCLKILMIRNCLIESRNLLRLNRRLLIQAYLKRMLLRIWFKRAMIHFLINLMKLSRNIKTL